MQINFLIEKHCIPNHSVYSAICKLELAQIPKVGRFVKTMMNQRPLCRICNQSEKHHVHHSLAM